MTAKAGGGKRVERKVKPADTQTDDDIWKSKQPLTPPTLPHSRGPPGRPGIKAKPAPASGPNDKKRQANGFSRLPLLMLLSQTQPSSLVWGKAWKYNKSLPSPAEDATASSWGQSWMFATHQPPSGEGHPCPNQEDPPSLRLWRKPDFRKVESRELDLSLTEEWQMSWKRFERNQTDESVDGNTVAKLVESQHQGDSLYSSEWIDSWLSTKPVNQQDHCAAPSEGLEKGLNEEGKLRGTSSSWEECWRLVNHHGNTSSKSSQHPEWDHSWRTATTVRNNLENPSQSQDLQSPDDQNQQGESHFSSTKHAPPSHDRGSHLQLRNELLTEWSNSWQIPKNNSKPCEEIDQVLKAPPPEADAAFEPQRVKKNPEVQDSADPRYEQLKHHVIHPTTSEFTRTKLPLLKMLQKAFPSPEWTESFKLIQHRRKLERRNVRLDSLKPLGQSGEDMKFTSSEWKHSWRFTPPSLNQNPELWQQGWSTSTLIRVNWERHQENVSLIKFPKNGPTTERIWGESWRFSGHQHRSEPGSEPGQDKEQVRNGKSNFSSHHPENSWKRRKLGWSVSDWQDSWMVSEGLLHHDKPPFAQWREAWRWSIYLTLNWAEQEPVDRWVDESVVTRQRAETGMRSLFENQMFRERFSEKEWSSSWRAGSLPSFSGSSPITEEHRSSSDAERGPSAGEYGSKWGRSFRLANPMPPLEQPWLETHPNPGHYSVLWSRTIKTPEDIKRSSDAIMFWTNSHQFLQNAQRKNNRKSKQPNDPRVISPEKIKTRKHLFLEKDKQLDRKWVGCHLLGKTQPRSKRSRGSGHQLKLEDNTKQKFCEEWLESWRFLVQPDSIKKKFIFKLLSGWNESWKFLLPRC